MQMKGDPKASSYEKIIILINANELNKILFDFFKNLTRNLNIVLRLEVKEIILL